MQQSYDQDRTPIDFRQKSTIFNKFGGNSILFSFIFKDDKPVLTAPTIQTIEDKEVISNPQEPMRIEEKVRY